MSKRVSEMNSLELLTLVRKGEISDMEVLEVLRSPYCTVEIAEIVSDSRHWLSSHGVRERLAGFRGLPLARAMNLIATLPWLSLLQLAREPRTPPVVRRHAEKKLVERIAKMTLGEKIALARRAHRPLFRSLIEFGDVRVLIAMLDNPRLVENDILLILNTTEVTLDFLQGVARHHRWGQYLGVRRALVECPHTPLPVALSALVQLPMRDIRRVAKHPKVSERIRGAAQALRDRDESGQRWVVRSSRDDGRADQPDPS